MKFDDEQIKRILLEGSYISDEDVANSEEFAKSHHSSFVEYFFSTGMLTMDLIGQAIAESFQVPYANLRSKQPQPDLVRKIPEDTAKKYHVILMSESETEIMVATYNPLDEAMVPELQTLFPNHTVQVTFALPEEIEANFVHYQKPLDTRFSKIIAGQTRVALELLDEIFSDALTLRTSDIHFEPQGKIVVVRFRIDGVLREAGRMPKEHYENVLNRIKVQSHLRIDEHFATQDGSLRFEKNGKSTDMRTSIIPTIEGEKVVLRVLASYLSSLTLSDIGLSPQHQAILEKSAAKPFGMIIVVGQTGSGKTTSLYALLRILNEPDVNITTIEDPVEYKMLGVNQIQVNPASDLTFAKGLRSIVRQDPDIILVGEIRDQETVEIAVNAALTGHMVLSTFHANDAATAIPRMLDMGIESFLLASSIEVIIAQRLVRKICQYCRRSINVPISEIAKQVDHPERFFIEENVTLYEGKKCDACSGTGFKGRTAIFEFLPMNTDIQALILKHPSSQEIWKVARQHGMRSIFEDGIDKVKSGVTTLEELLRVVEPPDFLEGDK